MTLLSSSPALSRRAQAALQSLFGVAPQADITSDDDDALDSLFSNPLLRKQWNSVASKCEVSGTIIHFLSVQESSENRDTETLSVLSLLGTEDGSVEESIRSSRAILAEHMTGSVTRVALKHSLGRSLTTYDLLGIGGGLPLLRAIDSTLASDNTSASSDRGLKEVALPHFDDAVYDDGRSLLSTLSESSLHRPAVGLYQFKQRGLALRPLPAATEDRVLPAPSFVFRCSDLEEPLEGGASTGKIGFSGTSRRGQLMVAHPDLPGLDLRLTDLMEYSSNFAEAQEALMAGSLQELQNENVLLEGGEGRQSNAKSDFMDGVGDCWAEFRANIKQPSGFIKRNPSESVKVAKIAKAPNLPYE